MQLTHNWRERSRNFNLSDFLNANEGKIGEMYLEEFPTEWHAINDWDYSDAIDWAIRKKEYFIEIMKDIYLDNIEG